jgi:hypothetical protein
MKWNNIIPAALVLAAGLAGLGGVPLAGTAEAGSAMGAEEDELRGVVITTQYVVPPAQAWLDEAAGRIYGQLNPAAQGGSSPEYLFDGVEGISFFYSIGTEDEAGVIIFHANDGVSDVDLDVQVTDLGRNVSLDGVIYVSALAGRQVFYLNPVYQQADGRIYLINGSGVEVPGEPDEGGIVNHKIDQTVESETDGVKRASSSSISLTFRKALPTESIRLLQMDRASKLIRQDKYLLEERPETVRVELGAAYLVVEVLARNAQDELITRRELYEQDDEALVFIDCGANGICVERTTQLVWN